eukprot:5896486-Pleurochrysis_carterae.AAC.1
MRRPCSCDAEDTTWQGRGSGADAYFDYLYPRTREVPYSHALAWHEGAGARAVLSSYAQRLAGKSRYQIFPFGNLLSFSFCQEAARRRQ